MYRSLYNAIYPDSLWTDFDDTDRRNREVDQFLSKVIVEAEKMLHRLFPPVSLQYHRELERNLRWLAQHQIKETRLTYGQIATEEIGRLSDAKKSKEIQKQIVKSDKQGEMLTGQQAIDNIHENRRDLVKKKVGVVAKLIGLRWGR